MNKLLQSSQDPNQLSMTIQGILIGLVPLMIGLFQAHDIPVAETQLVEIIQQIGAVIAAATMLFGVIRRVVNLTKNIFYGS